jgi:hypothetical protein
MNRLYQWLSRRASSFRSDTSGRGASRIVQTVRTVRTEVTVEQRGITLLVDGAVAGDHDQVAHGSAPLNPGYRLGETTGGAAGSAQTGISVSRSKEALPKEKNICGPKE